MKTRRASQGRPKKTFLSIAALWWLVGLAAPAAFACTGDCNGDGEVSIDEIVLAVNVGLGLASPDVCRAADENGDGAVSIDELVRAVNAGLSGCATATPGPAPTPTPTASDVCAGVPTVAGTDVRSELVADGLDLPVHVSAPPGGVDRLFVVEQRGRIRVIDHGALRADPFLDISGQVSCCGERGLLSVAFHPRFADNGWLFVDYTRANGDTVIARFQADPDRQHASADSRHVLLTVAQPFPNHNGGQLAFGPDGDLYAGLGDGGSGGDPHDNGQSDATVLGKLLRMDVDVDTPPYHAVPPDNPHAERGDPLGLVWAKGLRNPWRFSFDRGGGDLYIADVGQDRFEEVDVQPASSAGGENYGWRVFEGASCYDPDPLPECPDPSGGFVAPVLVYGHDQRCSITGGFVYRGCALPDLRGTYFYSDYCAPFIRTFVLRDGAVTDERDRTADLEPPGGRHIDSVSSFGEDARGELYIADYADGEIYRIVPR